MSIVADHADLLPPEDEQLEVEPRSQWQLFRRRFFRHKAAMASAVVLILLCIACFGATWIAPFHKNEQNVLLSATAPSGKHWFGTDVLGRDTLTEIMFAGRVSLEIGLAVALLSTVLGTAIGAVAGYFSKVTDQMLMRFTDLFLVVPDIALLAVALQKFGQTPHPSQLHRADRGQRHLGGGGRHRHRIDPVVPGVRGAAADDLVGGDAVRRRGQLQQPHQPALLPRPRHPAHGAVRELPG
jgi:hypothetical protein